MTCETPWVGPKSDRCYRPPCNFHSNNSRYDAYFKNKLSSLKFTSLISDLGRAAGAAGVPLSNAANQFGVETDKLAQLRAQGATAQEQKQQQLDTLKAANDVEEKAKKALQAATAAAQAYHKGTFQNR